VVVQETAQAPEATPLAFLMEAATLRKEFEIREVSPAALPGKSARLELTPRKPLPNVRRLLLEVERASGLIAKPAAFDDVGNTIVITLTDQRLNAGLPDSRFTFTPPRGVRVIQRPIPHPGAHRGGW
jgi:outer membrane lipoprotein-sorting protein